MKKGTGCVTRDKNLVYTASGSQPCPYDTDDQRGGDAGRVATVAAYSSGDSLSSRLIASRTSAPPSVAFVPWGEVGETGCPRNINNRVLPGVFQEEGSTPFGNPNHVVTFTLSGGGTGCPLRIRWSRSSWSTVRSKARSNVVRYRSKRSRLVKFSTSIGKFSPRNIKSPQTSFPCWLTTSDSPQLTIYNILYTLRLCRRTLRTPRLSGWATLKKSCLRGPLRLRLASVLNFARFKKVRCRVIPSLSPVLARASESFVRRMLIFGTE